MDLIYINDLRVATVIGVYAWERRVKQTVRLHIELGVDLRAAAASDDVARTVSYRDVAERVAGFIAASEFRLLETLAERSAELILSEFAVSWLRLRVGKPGAVAAAAEVGVVIERGEKP